MNPYIRFLTSVHEFVHVHVRKSIVVYSVLGFLFCWVDR